MQEIIYLRKLKLSDINKKYLFWVNDPSVTEYLEIGKQRLKYNDLMNYIKESPKKGRYNYAIITKNSKTHIGNSSIYSIELDKKNFQIGWFIGNKKFWGGHYSSMIIFYLLKIGFMKMGLEKCTGAVNEKHVKARMTNKFAGFEEKEKKYNKINNKKITLIKLEITKKKWLANANLLNSKYPKLYNLK